MLMFQSADIQIDGLPYKALDVILVCQGQHRRMHRKGKLGCNSNRIIVVPDVEVVDHHLDQFQGVLAQAIDSRSGFLQRGQYIVTAV